MIRRRVEPLETLINQRLTSQNNERQVERQRTSLCSVVKRPMRRAKGR